MEGEHRELLREARRIAALLEKPGIDSSLPRLALEHRVEKGEACRLAGQISRLVESYRALEEGGAPSNAYLALEAVSLVFDRLCRGVQIDEELVALALGVLGLLESGKVSRAAAVAAVITSRLKRSL